MAQINLITHLHRRCHHLCKLLFQKFAHANNKKNTKAQNQWSFVRGIHRWLDCCVAKTSQPVASYTILHTDGHISTNLFITAINNTDMTVLRKYITSQWRYVRDMAFQITAYSTVVFRLNKGDTKARHYWPFVRGIHRYPIITIIIIILSSLSLFSIISVIVVIVIVVCLCYHDYNLYYYHYYYYHHRHHHHHHYYYCWHYQYYYHHHHHIIIIIIIDGIVIISINIIVNIIIILCIFNNLCMCMWT